MMQRMVDMTGPTVSIETEDAVKAAAEWHRYADKLEEHGNRQHVPLDQLRGALGDVYGDYLDAKAGEYEARSAAYQRVAGQARGHAQHLENTVRNLSTADEDSASSIGRVLEA
jgi:hypothetical protein